MTKTVPIQEGDFNSRLAKQLMDDGVYALKISGGYFQRNGSPDFVMQIPNTKLYDFVNIEPSKTIWCEVKLDYYQVEPLQYEELKRIEKCGGDTCVLRVFWTERRLVFENKDGLPVCEEKFEFVTKLVEPFIRGIRRYLGA